MPTEFQLRDTKDSKQFMFSSIISSVALLNVHLQRRGLDAHPSPSGQDPGRQEQASCLSLAQPFYHSFASILEMPSESSFLCLPSDTNLSTGAPTPTTEDSPGRSQLAAAD